MGGEILQKGVGSGRQGDKETRRRGDKGTGRREDAETKRFEFFVSLSPLPLSPCPPFPTPFILLWTRRRKGGHILLRESRRHLVAHGQLVDGGGDDDGRFLHVVFDDALVSVEVGVPGVVEVFDRVLAHSDAGQTGLTE